MKTIRATGNIKASKRSARVKLKEMPFDSYDWRQDKFVHATGYGIMRVMRSPNADGSVFRYWYLANEYE